MIARIRRVVWSWDFGIAVATTLGSWFLLPACIPSAAAREVYGVSISVLSIVFSVYFAAMAIILSAGDNSFIKSLEKERIYTELIWTYRWTLRALLVALVFALGLYAGTALSGSDANATQPRVWMCIFVGLTLYALLAAFFAAMDATEYARRRAKFVADNDASS